MSRCGIALLMYCCGNPHRECQVAAEDETVSTSAGMLGWLGDIVRSVSPFRGRPGSSPDGGASKEARGDSEQIAADAGVAMEEEARV